MAEPWDNAHDILDRIGCPGKRKYDSAFDRINLAGNRLMLRPEGEPDTADLVGKINEICDRAGLGEGSPVELVQALADMHAEVRADLDNVTSVLRDAGYLFGTPAGRARALMQERDDLRKLTKDLRAYLEAERAQLDAKPGRLDVLPPPAFIESLRSLGVVGDVTVRVTH